MFMLKGAELDRGWIDEFFNLAELSLDTRTFNTCLARAKDFGECTRTLDFMRRSAIPLDLFSYNLVLKRAESFDDAQSIYKDLIASEQKPDSYSFNSLLQVARSRDSIQWVLSEMARHLVSPDEYTISNLYLFYGHTGLTGPEVARSIAYDAATPAQLIHLTKLLRRRKATGKAYFGAFTKRLAMLTSAIELFSNCFALSKELGFVFPFDQFGAAIAQYLHQHETQEALRIASAFPYLSASVRLFRELPDVSIEFLQARYCDNEEPWHASNALAQCYFVNGDVDQAKLWATRASSYSNLPDKAIDGLKRILGTQYAPAKS
jgi:hypothetical protein